MDDLTTQLLHGDLEVECPKCTYPIWVKYSEIVVEVAVLCPCCRVTIALVDTRASMALAGVEIEREIDSVLKGFFG
jgi:Zn finger protein HypA/HybF involved in hydrogenase expression